MHSIMIPCDFGGRKAPWMLYVGEPRDDNHPLQNQAWWLSSVRGGTIPQDVMDSFSKLHKIAKENNVSFEELCVYAMGSAMGEVTEDPAPPMSDEEKKEKELAAQQAHTDRVEAEAAAAEQNPSDPQPD